MEKLLILIVAISILGGVNSLQCYRCTNCTEVKDEQLVTCGSNTTVTTTTTTTTQAPNTNTSTTASTTTTVTTTKPINSTTNGTTTSTTTTTTSPSTTLPSNVTTNSTVNETQEIPETFRFRRSADEEDNCFCDNNGVCNCHGLRIIQFRDVKATSYVCVTDTQQVNGATVINRGCAVKHNQTQETCISSAYSSNCTVCETDKCNDAASINFSMLVLVTSLFAAVKIV